MKTKTKKGSPFASELLRNLSSQQCKRSWEEEVAGRLVCDLFFATDNAEFAHFSK
jgi:hypothetical protein